MKSLLIADQSQFGNHVDTYKYARLLQRHCSITFICWDFGIRKMDPQQASVVYVSREGGKLKRVARYIREVHREIRTKKYDVVLVLHFSLCFLFRVLNPRQLVVLEIVTGYERDSAINKAFRDTLLLLESFCFNHVAVQSEGLRSQLRIPRRKSYIIPVGADKVKTAPKEFSAVRLFYVGTLEFRRIGDSVLGFEQFYNEFCDRVPMSYDIVGFGSSADEALLLEKIANSACKEVVRFHGRVPHDELLPFLDRGTIGVAFIPIVRPFDYQPATKVFEYLLSGMPVLATATKENALVIDDSNGVLVKDSPEGVYDGLKKMYERLGSYDSAKIKSDSVRYSWENVILAGFKEYLDGLVRQRKPRNVRSISPVTHNTNEGGT